MQIIQPNCRVQFTAEDIDFILEVFRPGVETRDCLLRLLSDEETRDLILDDEKLLQAVLEHRGCLRVSTHFYFYVLVRHVLRRSGLKDRLVADYVAELLAQFSQAERMQFKVGGEPRAFDYFCDLLAALQTVDETTRFYIRAHVGNYSLFLSGVFPDRIRYRAEYRGAPSLRFYEDLGRSNFRAVSDHYLAHKYDLASIFNTLAERFQETRLALNDLGDRLLSLGDPDCSRPLLLLGDSRPGQM